MQNIYIEVLKKSPCQRKLVLCPLIKMKGNTPVFIIGYCII